MKNAKYKIEKVSSRGVLFTFYDLGGLPTTAYVIDGARHAFVIDTFLGSGSMAPVLEHLERDCRGKPVVVFNTHYHWDHVWGNCAFPGAAVVAHHLTRQKIIEVGDRELETYQQYRQGQVKLVLPELTFNSKLVLEEDQIEFFHSPGHTEDSSSCLDRTDGVLLVGDNVELPLPYLNWARLDRYLETLEGYLDMQAGRIIAGHLPDVSPDVIKLNTQYIRDFISGETKRYETGDARETHLQNRATMEGSDNRG